MSSARILDGKAAAGLVKAEIREHISREKLSLGLGTIIVGDDPGSHSYVAGKHRDCAEVGINSLRIELPANASQSDILKAISDFNSAQECTGFILQLPLPQGIDTNVVLEAIDPEKDADGLHPLNLGRLVLGRPGPRPCTPLAILELAHMNEISFEGKNVLVLGRGTTVGRPLSILLSSREVNATVTQAHTGTRNLLELTKGSEIIVVAIGKPHFLDRSMIEPGVIVFDVGISRTSSGLIGDVATDVEEVAAAISKTPGGVGPMTRAMLLRNLLTLGKKS
jgi:methylenetetrahydrofolate dehydrogenase (NADP+)/methenyltetrahydrofolate cyclohydrolase